MLRRASLVLAACGMVALASHAAALPVSCSIHPKKGASKTELASLARISEGDARNAALGSLKSAAGATVKETELEAEHGCLVWSFDIQLAGKAGIQEIQVDAGNGKILSSEHESPKAEAAEKARDKAKP
jgi:hypothetical protein